MEENSTFVACEQDRQHGLWRPKDGVELYLNHTTAHQQNLKFQDLNSMLKHRRCESCRQVSMRIEIMPRYGVCKPCRSQLIKNPDYIPGWLPIWVGSDRKTHYEVPSCLRRLREGEKLLIQKVSTYVPIRFLKGGSHGSRGHVCSFPKDLKDFVNELPRKNVEAIKVIRKIITKENEVEDSMFKIRRSVVLEALVWLKNHNKYYFDININEDNLAWMGGKEEKELPVEVKDDVNISPPDVERERDRYSSVDSEISAYGFIEHDNNRDIPKEKDQEIVEIIQLLKDERSKPTNIVDEDSDIGYDRNNGTMMFPNVGSEAIDEYDDSIRIFSMGFPWLFPGGVGDWADIKSAEGITVDEWARKLLYFEDGRFAKDKIWCFYALNYANRRANMKQGDFFVKQFAGKDQPQTLEELQERIKKGDDTWIDKICYFANTVKGSSPYWRQRRDEISSWIHYHVTKGNGAPTVFLTLSCAEHYWPDIKDLLRERQSFEPTTAKSQNGKSVAVNEYALVIQEYFQRRVTNWLETVGKHVLKIKHYWLRFEFAPGQGQIHAHCLLIMDNMTVQKQAHDAKTNSDKIQDEFEVQRAKIYEDWLQKEMCFTTGIPSEYDAKDYKPDLEGENHPASSNLPFVADESLFEDGAKLLMSVQNHYCTDYCLRKRKFFQKGEDTTSKKRRFCRSGCGVEKTPGKADTPGFCNIPYAMIVKHPQGGYKRLELPRQQPKSRRNILSTSMAVLFGWRANCDVKVLLYESDPFNPDDRDITKVTNYLVSYASKGTETIISEKEQLRSIILASQEGSGCLRDVISLARRILNRYLGEKLISKQECMVHLAGLDLYHCSESFERISLSGYTRLTKNGTNGINKYLNTYAHRDITAIEQRRLSFFSWYMRNHAVRRGKEFVPHFPGRGCQPVYPLTEHNSKMLLVIHKPWSNVAPLGRNEYNRQLRHFLQSTDCPKALRLSYNRDVYIANNPASEPVDSSSGPDQTEASLQADPDLQDAVDCYAQITTVSKAQNTYDFDYNFGIDYDWSRNHTNLYVDIKRASSWLGDEILKAEEMLDDRLQLPFNPNRTDGRYRLEDLLEEQQQIAFEIVCKIKQWVESSETEQGLRSFEPLRLTIRGKAGCGKTTLIHTLVTIVKSLFQTNDCVSVVCPSGCAASNAGGKTIHNRFRVPIKTKSLFPGTMKANILRKENALLTMLIVDERSMVSAGVIGTLNSYLEQTAHNGKNCSHKYGWGGIPVVLFFGDDGQLPPIGLGAFDFECYHKGITGPEVRGLSVFRTMGENVRTLSTNVRQQGQSEFQEILDEVYTGYVSQKSQERLMLLHLDDNEFSAEDRDTIAARSVFLFANKEPMERHNERALYKDSGPKNPVARIKGIDSGNGSGSKVHHEMSVPKTVLLARRSKVALSGRNLRPEWGLYNNAPGIVVDIMFATGESPNKKNLPCCILVDIPSYSGPPFCSLIPTIVPIAPVSVQCEQRCCSRRQVPLRLAYGQTIHTFQGATVGPKLQSRNFLAESIIIDPGTLTFEGRTPGLFYSALSRGTTIGIPAMALSSAVYFQGKNMSVGRIKNMVHGQDGKLFSRVFKRDNWTRYLDENDRKAKICQAERRAVTDWLQTSRMDEPTLKNIISRHSTNNSISRT